MTPLKNERVLLGLTNRNGFPRDRLKIRDALHPLCSCFFCCLKVQIFLASLNLFMGISDEYGFSWALPMCDTFIEIKIYKYVYIFKTVPQILMIFSQLLEIIALGGIFGDFYKLSDFAENLYPG